MYEPFFGMDRRPFATTPDPGCFFPADPVQEALDELLLCVQRGQGIGILTAPAGMGKTLFCQRLVQELAGRFQTVFLGNSNFPTRRSLLQAILFELGDDYSRRDEAELRLDLIARLRAAQEQRFLALVIDEAHLFSDELLEEIRTLADLAQNGTPLVRVILSAQLDLEERLTTRSLDAINQRLSNHVYLENLTISESIGYLKYRVNWAGGTVSDVFEDAALNIIARASTGLPRCLNQLADHSLLLAYAEDEKPVTEKTVREALEDLKQLPLHWNDVNDGISTIGWQDDELPDDSFLEDELPDAAFPEDSLPESPHAFETFEEPSVFETGSELSQSPFDQPVAVQSAQQESAGIECDWFRPGSGDSASDVEVGFDIVPPSASFEFSSDPTDDESGVDFEATVTDESVSVDSDVEADQVSDLDFVEEFEQVESGANPDADLDERQTAPVSALSESEQNPADRDIVESAAHEFSFDFDDEDVPPALPVELISGISFEIAPDGRFVSGAPVRPQQPVRPASPATVAVADSALPGIEVVAVAKEVAAVAKAEAATDDAIPESALTQEPAPESESSETAAGFEFDFRPEAEAAIRTEEAEAAVGTETKTETAAELQAAAETETRLGNADSASFELVSDARCGFLENHDSEPVSSNSITDEESTMSTAGSSALRYDFSETGAHQPPGPGTAAPRRVTGVRGLTQSCSAVGFEEFVVEDPYALLEEPRSAGIVWNLHSPRFPSLAVVSEGAGDSASTHPAAPASQKSAKAAATDDNEASDVLAAAAAEFSELAHDDDEIDAIPYRPLAVLAENDDECDVVPAAVSRPFNFDVVSASDPRSESSDPDTDTADDDDSFGAGIYDVESSETSLDVVMPEDDESIVSMHDYVNDRSQAATAKNVEPSNTESDDLIARFDREISFAESRTEQRETPSSRNESDRIPVRLSQPDMFLDAIVPLLSELDDDGIPACDSDRSVLDIEAELLNEVHFGSQDIEDELGAAVLDMCLDARMAVHEAREAARKETESASPASAAATDFNEDDLFDIVEPTFELPELPAPQRDDRATDRSDGPRSESPRATPRSRRPLGRLFSELRKRQHPE